MNENSYVNTYGWIAVIPIYIIAKSKFRVEFDITRF